MPEEIGRQDQIKRLNQIGIALSGETDLGKLLNLIVKEGRSFTNADAGSLYINEDSKLYFEVAQNDTLNIKTDGGKGSFSSFPLPLSKKSIAGYVAITGKTLNIADVYRIPESEEYSFNQEFDKRNKYGTQSMLVVPMKDHEGETVGVLQLINSLSAKKKVIPFLKPYEELISSLASQAAVAIRNARLIRQMRRQLESYVEASVTAIDFRSPYTAGHSKRVADYCLRIAKSINEKKEGYFNATFFSKEEIEEINYAAWLHDIGKLGVSEMILDKAVKLSHRKGMELIECRFAMIQMGKIIFLLKKKLQIFKKKFQLKSQEKKEIRESFAQIDKKVSRFRKKIEEELKFISKINTPGFFSDKEKKRLNKIHQKIFRNIDGEKSPYLSTEEHECLSVSKGSLTSKEYEEIQSHVKHTLNIIEKIEFTKDLKHIPVYASAHHEMLNGSGYPLGITENKIPLQSKIMAIADVYDALTAADRPYKAALPEKKALEIIKDEAKKHRLDNNIVNLFIEERLFENPPS